MSEIKVLGWLLKRIKRRIPMLILLILVSAGSSILSVQFALGSRAVINGATSGSMDTFLKACGTQLAVICGLVVCVVATKYLNPRLNDDLDRDWKKALLSGLLRGEFSEVSKFHSGELINRLNNDVRIVNDGLIAAIPSLVSVSTQLIAAVGTLFAISPLFTGALVVLGGTVVLLSGLVRKRLKVLHKKVSASEGRVLGLFQESLEKLLAVQAMNLNVQVEDRADMLLGERYRLQRRRRKIAMLAHGGLGMLMYLCGFITLVWCSYSMLMGTMDFGTVTAMIQLVNQIQLPFANISGFMPKFAAMMAAAERLMELDQILPQETARIENVDAYYKEISRFEVRDLTFGYEDETILADVNFDLPKGVFAAITGASGIGKSTLLKLMLGIYKPQSGGIYAVQREERKLLGRMTRGLIAYVPQGNFLFSGTVRENLMMINPDADEASLQKAVYVSAMDQFIEQLPNGLETVIGERGEGLSEGQAQRISIARAILSGAPVLLLDEATSALDSETETMVLQRIFALKDRTCIAVTHRPAALEQAEYQLHVKDRKIEAIALK